MDVVITRIMRSFQITPYLSIAQQYDSMKHDI